MDHSLLQVVLDLCLAELVQLVKLAPMVNAFLHLAMEHVPLLLKLVILPPMLACVLLDTLL